VSRTDVRNTPTLVVTYGGLNGEYWWYARDRCGKTALNRFFPKENWPRARSAARPRRIGTITTSKWPSPPSALRDAGVRIQIGGHGQLQGLSPHWEIWMLTQGGFSNFEALRAATIDGADYIGLGKKLGSLEAGKQADLVVLNGNPLDNIRSTATRDT
jgi:hypothetical protein